MLRNMSRRRVSLEKAQDFAESEYGGYQGHLANMLMMGTLLFGFCVTGTFLSVSFTGEEASMDNGYLVTFVQAGLYSAISSLVAIIITFIFSTRAATMYLQYGARAALRTIYRTIFFIGVAEMLLYFSLSEFMMSIRSYTKMNYMGPDICPLSEPGDYYHPRVWTNNSFCAQSGISFFGAAGGLCAPARAVQLEDDTNHCLAVSRSPNGSPNDTQPFAACSIFDCYYAIEGNDGGIWFAWEDPTDYTHGYEYLTRIGTMTVRQAFWRVLQEVTEKQCGKNEAQAAMEEFCAPPSQYTLACVQARESYILADDCSGGKADDAIKCRKVCQWADEGDGSGERGPLKEVLGTKLDFWFDLIWWLIRGVMVIRGATALITTYKCCAALVEEDPSSALWGFDVCGLCDSYSIHVTDELDAEDSDDNESRRTLGDQ